MIRVIHEERQFIVVAKGAGVLSQGDKTGHDCVADLVRRHLLDSAAAAGRGGAYNPFVAPAHRLDRPVSGVMVLARTSKCARRLGAQFAASQAVKGYVAVTSSKPSADCGRVQLWLKKDRRKNVVVAAPAESPSARWSATGYQVVATNGELSLVALFPETGRPHQLRVTMANMGCPIAGDLKYGSPVALGGFIALHGLRAGFAHPISGEHVTFLAPLPDNWLGHFPWLSNALAPAFLPGAGSCCANGRQ